ncbi:hypothetical protein T492DRAFT_1055597 [Pavlovales sp. CCMP2436]|nr:hypothetical protein T492DRAFT_1055597 [Pavlovales sp. CCMP2436]
MASGSLRPALLLAGAILSLAEPTALHSLAPHTRPVRGLLGVWRRLPAAALRPDGVQLSESRGGGREGESGEQSGGGAEERRGGLLVSSSRSMLLCYAVASVVNAAVLLVAALALSYIRGTDLPSTFSAVYVTAGSVVRPVKVSLGLFMVPIARKRTDHLDWLRFSMLFVPLFATNLLITCFAHGRAAMWLYEKAFQPLWIRARS